MRNKAIFFDKDGVLNIDKGIIGTFEDVEFYPGIEDVLAYCRQKGYKIFVVTNQPIVARGIIKEIELKTILDDFKKSLQKLNTEAKIDKIYYCPHHPNADIEKYRKKCSCRKPKPGMLLKAKKEYDIDLSASYMIGDRPSDITAGNLALCKTIQVLSGKHDDKMIETDLILDNDIKPDFVISSILELREVL